MKKLTDLLKEVKLPESHMPVSDVHAANSLSSTKDSRALSTINKRLARSSYDISTEEPDSITYQYSVLCQTGLPYRNPGDELRKWERKQGMATLLINAGEILNPKTQKFVDVGWSFGTKPRLILAHLNSEAIKKSSSLIDVGSSLTGIVRRIGLDTYGKDIIAIKNQLSPLSCSTVCLGFVENYQAVQVNTQIVTAFNLWIEKNERPRVLWPSTIKLSEEYFTSLITHAVPLDERGRSIAFPLCYGCGDIYAWLAQRLHRNISEETTIYYMGGPQGSIWLALSTN